MFTVLLLSVAFSVLRIRAAHSVQAVQSPVARNGLRARQRGLTGRVTNDAHRGCLLWFLSDSDGRGADASGRNKAKRASRFDKGFPQARYDPPQPNRFSDDREKIVCSDLSVDKKSDIGWMPTKCNHEPRDSW